MPQHRITDNVIEPIGRFVWLVFTITEAIAVDLRTIVFFVIPPGNSRTKGNRMELSGTQNQERITDHCKAVSAIRRRRFQTASRPVFGVEYRLKVSSSRSALFHGLWQGYFEILRQIKKLGPDVLYLSIRGQGHLFRNA